MDNEDPETFDELIVVEESEVDLAELKQGPPYSCKQLVPSNGKNPVGPDRTNDRFPKKTDRKSVV